MADRARELEELLSKGYHLVESAVVHVTHGGPTIEQAQAWLTAVKDAGVDTGIISVRVGTEAEKLRDEVRATGGDCGIV